MVKQQNIVWLTAEITAEQLQNTSSTLIAFSTCPQHVLLFLSRGIGKVYCDIITEAVNSFNRHLL